MRVQRAFTTCFMMQLFFSLASRVEVPDVDLWASWGEKSQTATMDTRYTTKDKDEHIKALLVSSEGAFTEAHIDYSGTSVWSYAVQVMYTYLVCDKG